VSMCRLFAMFFTILRATVMAASSALLIACRSDCYLISTCAVVLVYGLTTSAPSIGLPLICEPSVYTKSRGLHFRLWGFVCCIFIIVCVFSGDDVSVYDFLLSMVCASFCVVPINVI
jgi:hypothetical protein